jgi:hypothetical protein
MKQLQTLHQWSGTRVHSTAAAIMDAARTGQPLEAAQAVEQLRNQIMCDWKDSKAGRYREQPKKYVGLTDHYYGITVPQASSQEIFDRARQCVENIFAYETYIDLVDHSVEFLEREEMGEFYLDGLLIWAKADLIVRRGSWIEIIDWKTGHVDEDDGLLLQLGTYALYSMHRYAVPGEQILVREVGLKSGMFISTLLSRKQLEVKREIMSSVADMQARLVDVAENMADINAFEMIGPGRTCGRRQVTLLPGQTG